MAKNRFSENTVLVTSRQAARFATGLRKIADEFDRLAAKMADLSEGGIEAGGLKTAMLGLVQISRFCGQVQEAYTESAALESAKEITGAKLELQRLIERLQEDAIADDATLSAEPAKPTHAEDLARTQAEINAFVERQEEKKTRRKK